MRSAWRGPGPVTRIPPPSLPAPLPRFRGHPPHRASEDTHRKSRNATPGVGAALVAARGGIWAAAVSLEHGQAQGLPPTTHRTTRAWADTGAAATSRPSVSNPFRVSMTPTLRGTCRAPSNGCRGHSGEFRICRGGACGRPGTPTVSGHLRAANALDRHRKGAVPRPPNARRQGGAAA